MDASFWVATAAVVSAIATATIAVLTYLLICENRKLRKAGKEPQVIAYLVPHVDGNGAVNIVFANVGMGLAKDVVFRIDCDHEDFNSHHVLMPTRNSAAPINTLPAGEKIVAIFGIGFELFGKVGKDQIGPLKPFSVKIDFSDIDGERASTSTTIDIRQFEGLPGMMNKPALREIQEALESMDKRFEVLAKASRKFIQFVDVTTLDDKVRQVQKGDGRKRSPRKAPQ
ncbi:hypothetical protein [Qipengyuania flava]|uniref:hypothetical protein n=1 Tax=Qipengyuania flava TaxID=192812 RepID=UPI001CD6DA6D|nr:hypothetical protein [Qipengyuania flava]MCA0890310.1 hypothetical protein [Qipengyuania flava]